MDQPKTKRNPIANISLWVIAILLVVEAVGTSIYVPQFSELFKGFERELPFLTKAVLTGAWVIWILLISITALIVFKKSIDEPPIFFGLIMLFLGLLWVPIAIYGLYLPVWQMSETELP
ncbi:MAG: hypothetical protein K1566_12125 [Candidatus Thiodiazotropha sp. (ex. Lucinisca nassula)]|nr:hypothetical protein [Candidatus Thiodiazotropha sp. (ex. Lucinisca nassula)]